MINILIELDIGVSDFIDQINIAHVSKQPPKTNSLLVAHWNCAPRWCIADWEAKFDYTDRWSGYLNSINNLPSFWILEWSCGKRVHDTCRMDWYLRSKTKKTCLFLTKNDWIGSWFLWRIRKYRKKAVVMKRILSLVDGRSAPSDGWFALT